ncbi:DUF2510 domain-containing protein [Pseudonocardia cypriaca]|nr:DUF2510 domain-containing protein [Pseudonocardia cypriaca]
MATWRGWLQQRRRIAPRYYLYLSRTKIEMLYPQVPRSFIRSLDAEVKASVGVVEATVKRGAEEERAGLELRAAIISDYLERHAEVGTVAEPKQYLKGTATMKYGIVSGYAADVAFFGGTIEGIRIGLIGSTTSVVGELERNESRHSLFYYTLKFLNRIARDPTGQHVSSSPPYFTHAQAFEIAAAATSQEADVEFVARVLHKEPDLIIATPIYVALASAPVVGQQPLPPATAAPPSQPQVPAGWYLDPSGQPYYRWWDGFQWTSSTMLRV